ncbi:MAG: MATE family efflux transporter, partial [Clostridiaceae bacterium]|nr:MATE family efflux transporter [Clostridiaceae bacterium]
VRYTMVVSILSMWFMRVGASYLLTMYFGLGVHGIWIGMYLDWFVRGAFFLPRSLGRKWLRHKTVS